MKCNIEKKIKQKKNGDSVFELTKARLPWLLIGMVVEIIASYILKGNEKAFHKFETLIIFVPLLSATAGNIGVQASAIVVQGLANGTLKEFNRNYLTKELSVAMISGTIISLMLLVFHSVVYQQYQVGMAISISIIVVILFAAITGKQAPNRPNWESRTKQKGHGENGAIGRRFSP